MKPLPQTLNGKSSRNHWNPCKGHCRNMQSYLRIMKKPFQVSTTVTFGVAFRKILCFGITFPILFQTFARNFLDSMYPFPSRKRSCALPKTWKYIAQTMILLPFRVPGEIPEGPRSMKKQPRTMKIHPETTKFRAKVIPKHEKLPQIHERFLQVV